MGKIHKQWVLKLLFISKLIADLFNIVLDSIFIANPCETNPCEHGGTCVFDHEHPPNYTCICMPRYEGIHCEKGCKKILLFFEFEYFSFLNQLD